MQTRILKNLFANFDGDKFNELKIPQLIFKGI